MRRYISEKRRDYELEKLKNEVRVFKETIDKSKLIKDIQSGLISAKIECNYPETDEFSNFVNQTFGVWDLWFKTVYNDENKEMLLKNSIISISEEEFEK